MVTDFPLAYFTSWSQGDAPGPGDGVRKKISEQIRYQRQLGADAKLFVLASRPCAGAWSRDLPAEAFEVFEHRGRLGRERACAAIAAAIERHRARVVYMRQEPFYPALTPAFLRRPLVIELNGNEAQETRDSAAYYRTYRRVSREIMARLATGIVAVSTEFLRLEPYASRKLETVVIANGIDLDSIVPLDEPAVSGGLRFAFIGGALGAAWHGVPKILDLARARPEWQFDLIGVARGELDGGVPPNVTPHGIMTREQYRPILARADAAFGSLSAHIKNNHEGSALKTREYLAHGIPTIIGYLDTDFLEPVPFLLRLPNTLENVATSMDAIGDFAHAWRGKRIDRAAILHLDSARKEARRLDFFRRLAR